MKLVAYIKQKKKNKINKLSVNEPFKYRGAQIKFKKRKKKKNKTKTHKSIRNERKKIFFIFTIAIPKANLTTAQFSQLQRFVCFFIISFYFVFIHSISLFYWNDNTIEYFIQLKPIQQYSNFFVFFSFINKYFFILISQLSSPPSIKRINLNPILFQSADFYQFICNRLSVFKSWLVTSLNKNKTTNTRMIKNLQLREIYVTNETSRPQNKQPE